MLFKHVQKTGGQTLVAWLAQLPWVTYVPGSRAVALPRESQVYPNSLRDFLQPYGPTTQSNHSKEASLQLRYVSNSSSVFPFRKTLSAGELLKYYFQRLGTGGFASPSHIPEDELEGSDAPPRALQPLTRDARPLAQRAGRIAIEIHGPPASDWGSLLAGIEVLHQSPSPCMATSVTIVREPLSYYRSKYIFHVASFPWAMRGKAFLEWLHAKPNDQSRDLLLGASRGTDRQTSRVKLMASLLRRIDIVATLDRFDDLVRLLCARLALPRCPCYKPQNSAPMAKFVQETTSLQREYNKSNLSPSAQFEAMVLSRGHGATVGGKEETRLLKLHTQVREVAWLDEMLYTQASIDFSAIIAAEGLRWGRENTTMECGI